MKQSITPPVRPQPRSSSPRPSPQPTPVLSHPGKNIRQAALPQTTALLIPVLTGVSKRQMVRLGAPRGTNYICARNAATPKAVPHAHDRIRYSEDLLVDGDASQPARSLTALQATSLSALTLTLVVGSPATSTAPTLAERDQRALAAAVRKSTTSVSAPTSPSIAYRMGEYSCVSVSGWVSSPAAVTTVTRWGGEDGKDMEPRVGQAMVGAKVRVGKAVIPPQTSQRVVDHRLSVNSLSGLKVLLGTISKLLAGSVSRSVSWSGPQKQLLEVLAS